MSFPEQYRDLASSWAPGQRLFRSWILLAGILPVEYDDLTLVELEPGRRFLERSQLLSQRVWEHERVLTPHQGATRIEDRIRFEPRLAALAPLYLLLFRAVFRYRHWKLRRIFGSQAG